MCFPFGEPMRLSALLTRKSAILSLAYTAYLGIKEVISDSFVKL